MPPPLATRLRRTITAPALLWLAVGGSLEAQESGSGPGSQASALGEAAPKPGAPALASALSAHGLPGLIHVPSAVILEPGYGHLSFNNTDDVHLRRDFDMSQRNLQFGFSLFSRLMVGGRGTEAELERDISANVQLLLLKEGRYLPALAVGAQDITGSEETPSGFAREGGNAIFEARYGVLTKTLPGGVRLTAGFGTGPDMLDGPFGGVEWFPSHHLGVLGEYDAERFGAGLRVRPLPRSWVARGVPQPTLELFWGEDADFSWSVGLRAALDLGLLKEEEAGGSREAGEDAEPLPAPETRAPAGPEPLVRALAEAGFENVRAWSDEAGRLTVEYENRRYNQHQADGLVPVLKTTAMHLPASTEDVRIVLKRLGAPVLDVELERGELERLVAGDRAARSRALEGARFSYADGDAGASGPRASANPSHLRSDLIFRPAVETLVYTEIGVFEARAYVLPNLVTQLFRGTEVDLEVRIPVAQTSNYELSGGRLPEPELERALLHHTRRIPLDLGPSRRLFAQWSGGRFDMDHVGVRQQAALFLMEGRLGLAADLALVGESFDELDEKVLLGSARYHHPGTDARISVTTGRFLDGDFGTIYDVSRFFGDTEVGVFLRDSEHGALGGVRIALPLGPSRSLPPSDLRPRLPARWAYAQWSRVFARATLLRPDITRSLPTENGLLRSYLDRDRLHPGLLENDLRNTRFWKE